jgi:protein-tyrosine kinase
MNRLLSQMSKYVMDEQVLVELDRQTIKLMPEQVELPDNGNQEGKRAQARRNKRRTENLKALDVYRRIHEYVMASPSFDPVAVEQYRKLYIEIAQARRTRPLQTLLITSPLAGEGKSISALNIAVTCAEHEGAHGVLLIDTDLRKPSIHQYLGIQPKWGLTDYLLGDVECSHIFFETQIPGLTLIAAGRKASNPTALFASARMAQLFQDIKSQKPYSSIILDSSPVLLTSEPKGLLQYVDTAILVVRASRTSAEVVSQTIKLLGKENILGCVLNAVTSSDFSFYH